MFHFKKFPSVDFMDLGTTYVLEVSKSSVRIGKHGSTQMLKDLLVLQAWCEDKLGHKAFRAFLRQDLAFDLHTASTPSKRGDKTVIVEVQVPSKHVEAFEALFCH